MVGTQKLLIVPDTHVPYHDQHAWALMLKIAKAWKPEIIIVLGDFCDFYAVSAHDKNPNRSADLAAELAVVKLELTRLDALGAKKKIFIAGNHENRLERYLMTKAPELFNVVRVERLLELKQRGWQYVPYKSYYRLGKVLFTHDLGKAGRFAVHGALTDAQTSVVIGHLHRLCYLVEGDALGTPRLAFCPGWLGDPTQADYMHQLKANRDWAQGFALGYLRSDGLIHFVPVPIVKRTAMVEGQLYAA